MSTAYELAREAYAAEGIDTEAVLAKLAGKAISVNCWQGDDVRGFDGDPNAPLTGGIQTTGNYPGRARTPEELMAEYTRRLGFYSCTVPAFEQYVLAEFINGGELERYINRRRRILRQEKKEK